MNRYFTLLTLLFFAPAIANAQKMSSSPVGIQYSTKACSASFTKIKIEGDNNAASILKILISQTKNLQNEHVSVKLNYVNESPDGLHYSFTQFYRGIPVYQSEIKVNTDKHNIIHSIFDNSYDTKLWSLSLPENSINPVIAINSKTEEPVIAELTVVNNTLETLTSGGEVIFQRDMNSYYQPQDSMVTGKVFNPDPLTTSQHVYTDIASIISGDTLHYDNNSGSDAPWMDAEQQTVNFMATFNDSVFTLASPYVELTNFSANLPDVTPVSSTTPQFNFNRSQSGFQDVNAFYHISTHRNYVAGLGFNCADSLVLIDTHALYSDNSFFSPSYYPRRILYGIGGVPDAEDADVVVHEYCHSLSYNCAPGSNIGEERNALDEAFCDYNAAAYSKARSTFNDEWVYNWDGHNQYWPGRVVNSSAVYPGSGHLSGNIYLDGEMWSAVLFALNGDLGRGITDSLIYQTHYSYAQNITMAHAALLLIDADSLLFNGAHYCTIYDRLLQHGFVSQSNNGCWPLAVNSYGETGDFGFTQTGNAFTLFNGDLTPVRIEVLSITGQLIAYIGPNGDAVFNYDNSKIASGVYLVNVVSANGSATFKWVKAGR